MKAVLAGHPRPKAHRAFRPIFIEIGNPDVGLSSASDGPQPQAFEEIEREPFLLRIRVQGEPRRVNTEPLSEVVGPPTHPADVAEPRPLLRIESGRWVDILVIRERAAKLHLAGREGLAVPIQDGSFELVEQRTHRIRDVHDVRRWARTWMRRTDSVAPARRASGSSAWGRPSGDQAS